MALSVDQFDGEEFIEYVSLRGEPTPVAGSPTDVGISSRMENLGKMSSNSSAMESMVFEESESMAWKSHHLKRFLTDRSSKSCLKSSRRTTIYKWCLVVLVGVTVALIGLSVTYLTETLSAVKYDLLAALTQKNEIAWAYVSFLLITVGYAAVAGVVIAFEPNAAGSGTPPAPEEESEVTGAR